MESDPKLKLYLCLSQKKTIMIQMNQTDTVRSAIKAARLSTPPNTQLICMLHGNALHLDLSLAKQGIKSNDTIKVLYRKLKIKKPKFGCNQILLNPSDIRQKEIFEERLRVADLAYLLLDYCMGSSVVYQEILKQQEKEQNLSKSKNISQKSVNFSDSDGFYTEDEDDIDDGYNDQFYTVQHDQQSEIDKTVIPSNPHISSTPLPTGWDNSSI